MSLQDSVQKMLDELCADPINKVPGAVVFAADRKGNTLAHAAAGVRGVDKPDEKMARNQLFAIHSCTKLVTAIAAMQLVEQGKLSLDEPIDGLLPELKGQDILENGKRRKNTVPITLNHLLSHTSGQSYPFFNDQTRVELEKVGAAGFGCEKASIMAPLASEPGTRWEYGTGIDWAGQAVERASGLDLDAYFKKHIFEPLRIKEITMRPDTGIPGGVKPRLASMHKRGADGKISVRDYLVQPDESKIEVQYGGAGLYGNASEYCQILVALLNDGQHPNGGRILKPESVKELMRDRLPEKLVPDLERPIVAAQPEMSNNFTVLEGIPKQWALAGCKTPEGMPNGRSGQSVWWAGIANHYWWLDQGDGTCGMIQTQVLPFFDAAHIVPAFFFQIEPAVHAAVKSA